MNFTGFSGRFQSQRVMAFPGVSIRVRMFQNVSESS